MEAEERILGGRAAVLGPMLVAVHSLATGITKGTVGISVAGPVAGEGPASRRTGLSPA